MSAVQILLSTFDGVAYLEPLLDSLLAQQGVEVSVLARDDGSSDATPEILERRAADPRVTYLAGPPETNRGVFASYLELLEQADAESPYFAFCDQDDVWLEDKLTRALELLGPMDASRPTLYCSRQILVNEQLETLSLSRRPARGPAFGNALVENIATGCTVVFNRAAREILLRGSPRNPVMHDWWAYIVVAAFGKVLFDDEARVLYRQHAGNVIGSQHRWWKSWALRAGRMRRHGERRVLWEQAVEFRDIHGPSLDDANRAILDRFIERRRKPLGGIRYAMLPDVFRQSLLDDLILRILIALGRI